MRNIMLGLALCLGLGTLAVRAQAASASGTVSRITIVGTQYALLNVNGLSGSHPACHNAIVQFIFALDLGTTKGRALLSLATAAQLAGKPVFLSGAGTCINTGAPNNNIEGVGQMDLDE